MTGKAGQKCTAIRRIIVPLERVDAVAERLRERLAKVTVGDPSVEGVRMGALASKDQQRDVAERVALLAEGNEIVFGQRDGFRPVGQGVGDGACFSPTLLLCRDARSNAAVHDIEAFGPVSTMMTYEGIDEALAAPALTGEVIDAAVAGQLGLVPHVVDVEQLEQTVDPACWSTVPAPWAKSRSSSANSSSAPVTPEVSELTAQTIARVRSTDEATEGFAAFFAK